VFGLGPTMSRVLSDLPTLGRPRTAKHPMRALIGVLIAVALVRLPFLAEPRWSSDDGFFTAVASAISRGTPLYAGVYDNSPPGIYWLYTLLLKLGDGQHHVVVQLASLVAVLACCLLTFRIGLRVMSSGAALLAAALAGLALSLPTLDGDLLNVELAALPFFLGALLLAHSGRWPGLLFAGLLFSAAVMIRPSFALDGLALLVPLLSAPHRRRRLLLVGAGTVLGGSAVLAGLFFQGSLGAFIGIELPSAHAYLIWSNAGSLWALWVRLAILGLAGLMAWRRMQGQSGRLLVVWLPATLAGSSLTPRGLSHYCHEAIPALALALAGLLFWLGLRRLAAPVGLVLLTAAAEALLWLPGVETAYLHSYPPPSPMLHNFAYSQLPGYYANWLSFQLGRTSQTRYRAFFPGDGARDAGEAVWLRTLARSESQRLTVLGDRPWLYVESGLLPATRYIATNSAFWRVRGAPQTLAHALRSGCAGIVVYASGPGNWSTDLRAGGYREQPGAPWPTYVRPTAPGCG